MFYNIALNIQMENDEHKCNFIIISYRHIIWVIKSQGMGWAEHVARLEKRREEVHTGFWWVNLRERHHLQDLGIDGRIMLSWITQIKHPTRCNNQS
jgi:hypothetical protein